MPSARRSPRMDTPRSTRCAPATGSEKASASAIGGTSTTPIHEQQGATMSNASEETPIPSLPSGGLMDRCRPSNMQCSVVSRAAATGIVVWWLALVVAAGWIACSVASTERMRLVSGGWTLMLTIGLLRRLRRFDDLRR
jgi:hypothetical protein